MKWERKHEKIQSDLKGLLEVEEREWGTGDRLKKPETGHVSFDEGGSSSQRAVKPQERT